MKTGKTNIKKRVFEIIQIGNKTDLLSKLFDLFIVVTIFANLTVTLFSTFEESIPYEGMLNGIEMITCAIFFVEYCLRIWVAEYRYPNYKGIKAIFKFVFSFYGIVDLLTFLPYFLPIVFPSGVVAFRMFRVIRIFRLFRINARYDAFNAIVDVLNEKKNQIISSVCMVLIFMVAASLCMYSLEHKAQPEAFENAFSGIWWSVSTLLTVGYGDIYPITTLGKIMAIIISFLGVGMVAIPTGIISAGFVEQYTKLRNIAFYGEERELRFVTSVVKAEHQWAGKAVREVVFPPQLLLIMIIRQGEVIVPKGDTILQSDDTLVIGAKNYKDADDIQLKEVVIKEAHLWVNKSIAELDIPRQELIVMIRRKNKTIIPNGKTKIKVGDIAVIYSRGKDEG